MSDEKDPATPPATPPGPTPPSPSQLPAVQGKAVTDGTLVPVTSLPGEAPTGTAVPIAGTAGAPPAPPGPVMDFPMRAAKKPFTIPPYAGCLVKMIFGLAVVLVMGYCALVALNPKAREWATQGKSDGSGGPTPFKAMNQILAIPAQAIGKTKDVVAAGDAHAGAVNSLVAEEEAKQKGGSASAGRNRAPVIDPFAKPDPKAKPAAGAAAGASTEPADNTISRSALLALAEKAQADSVVSGRPGQAKSTEPAPPPPGPPELKMSGGIVITNNAEVGGPPATAPFMYWVAGMNITGISQTNPPRFLLNNRLVYAGDEVNKTQGIIFLRLDPVAKLLYFRDKTGAVISRSYL